MNWRKFWAWMTIPMILVWISVDIFVFNKYENATLSVILTDYNNQNPWVGLLLSFIFGGLISHWFWPAKGSEDE